MSKELYQLVKTLGKREVKLVKIQLAGKKQELSMFNFYLKQLKYSSNAVLADKAKIPLKSISVVKNQLLDSVLISLRSATPIQDVNNELFGLISDVHFLYINKKQYALAEKILLKAEQIAEKHEKFWFLTIIEHLKYELLSLQKKMDNEETDYSKFFTKAKEYSNLYFREYDYIELDSEFVLLERANGLIRDDLRMEKFNCLLSNILFLDESKALTFDSKLRRLNILSVYNELIGDFKKSHNLYKEIMTILNENQELAYLKPSHYINHLTNYGIDVGTVFFDEIQLEETLKKLRNLSDFSRIDQDIAIAKSYFIEQYSCIHRKEINKAYMLIEKGTKAMDNCGDGLREDYRLNFLFNNLVTCIYLNKLNEADAFRAVITNISVKFRFDVLAMSHILHLLILFDKNHLNIDHVARNKKYFLKKHELFYKFEITLFKGLKSISKNNSKAKWVKLKNELLLLKNDKLEANAFEYFNFIDWVNERTPIK